MEIITITMAPLLPTDPLPRTIQSDLIVSETMKWSSSGMMTLKPCYQSKNMSLRWLRGHGGGGC
jgi:hypothetical protein